MNFFREIFGGKVTLHIALITMSFLFVYIFSYTTSFRYSLLGGDSPIFQVIGKYWTQGYLPYVDLFDHKGPLIFLVNALGYAIYPRSGIMVPQIIFMYLSCLFIWRAIEIYWSGKTKMLFLLLTLIYYAAHYWEGNNSGEYTMPFLAASAYCFLRYLKDNEISCPLLYGLIYGISFGGCVLIRASNAMPTCCFAFLTAVFLFRARAFKNLWQNILSFCVGFVSIVLPFVIYFAAHDALYEALYGTILFNTNYAIHGGIEYGLEQRLSYILFKLMPVFLMIFFGTILLARDADDKLAWSGIFIGVMILTLLMNLRLYIHYYMIVVPTSPFLFAILKQLRETDKKFLSAPGFSLSRVFYVTAVIGATTYAIFTLLIYSLPLAAYFNSKLVDKQEESYLKELHGVQELASIIPNSERTSFTCWGDFCSTSHWILETNMKPRERFFMNNTDLSLLDSRLKEEWFRNVLSSPPLWILYGTNKHEKATYYIDDHRGDSDVERLLAEKYILRGETMIYDQIMRLYRLND